MLRLVGSCTTTTRGVTATAPLPFWWLDPATVYSLSLALIATVYIGFAVADGRWVVIAVEIVAGVHFNG